MSHFDKQALMRTYGEGDLLQRLLTTFEATTRADLSSLAKAVAQQDADLAHRMLHRIAGGARTLLVPSMADAAQHFMEIVETEGTSRHQEGIAAFIAETREALDEIPRLFPALNR